MEVYLIRHAEAVELDNEIIEESFRYISASGREKAKKVAEHILTLKTSFDVIVSSPLVRAVQTAEVFAKKMKFNGEIKTAIELIGGNTFNRFQQVLRRNLHHKRIGIFGHAPDVNNYALKMIGHDNIHQLKINFKNSSVCKIEYDIEKEEGKFCWFLNSDSMELTKG